MVEKQPKFLTDKRDISQRVGNKDILNKKPYINPKYNSVKSSVDTGKSVKNVNLQSDQLISKRKSELFKRVKGGAIIKLLNEEQLKESIYNLGNEGGYGGDNVNLYSYALILLYIYIYIYILHMLKYPNCNILMLFSDGQFINKQQYLQYY